MIGTVVEHYKITSRIAAGGMGEVFRAIDLELDREVAIKCVRPELSELDEATQRFRTEARTLARLSHPNIATVHRFFAHEDRLFLVMEYIDGKPFGDMISGDNSLPFDRSIRLIQDALKGLGYAHANDVVHRDIKPGNLMVDQQSTVKVLDFGIAHLVGGTRLTRIGSVVGTPAYMAPEQILGKDIDPRTDLYAIGVVLYEMLVGKLPYEGNTDFEIMRAHLESVPRPLQELSNNNVPDELQHTISRAMAKETGERFQTADEFVSALSAIGADYVKKDQTKPNAAPVVSSKAKTEVLPITPAEAAAANEETLGAVLKPVAREIRKRLNLQQIGLGAVAALVIAFGLFTALQSRQTGPDQGQPTNNAGNIDSGTDQIQTNSGAINSSESTPATNMADNVGSVVVQTTEAIDNQAQLNAGTSPEPPAQSATQQIQSGVPTSLQAQTADRKTQDITQPGTSSSSREVTPLPTRASTNDDAPVRQRASTPTIAQPAIKVSVVKVAVHEKQGTGRFSRAAGYNGAFNLAVPAGANRNVQLAEIVEIYRDGTLVRSTDVITESRVAGQFKSKHRINGLKTLAPGVYNLRLLFVHEGTTVGTHSWELKVEG